MVGDLDYMSPLGKSKSQHVILLFDITYEVKCKAATTTVFRYQKADYDGMIDYLQRVDWDMMLAHDQVDRCWDDF
jgi:hypothetical protein